MIYFDMVRMWGSVPLITTIGMILLESIDAVYPQYFPKQNSEEEVYKQIEKDLLESLSAAPNMDAGNKTRLSKP